MDVTIDELLPRVLPAAWHEESSPGPGGRCFRRRDGLVVIASVDRERDGHVWLHVSLSRAARVPDYGDIVEVKDLFIGGEREALQVFAPRAEWVSDHPYCLHLWHRVGRRVMPDLRRVTMSGRPTL